MQRTSLILCAALGAAAAMWTNSSSASVSYNTVGSTYSQNFDTLPTTPENASLQTTAVWIDDTSPTPANSSSIQGWYLYHGLSPAAEGGTDGHQRLRASIGNSNTGSFFSFGSTGATDRALGSIGSTTVATNPGATPDLSFMYTALRLTNNTGQTLGSFTLNYTGEQWRDGGATGGTPETLLFDYSTNATFDGANGGFTGGTFTPVSALNFSTPVNGTATALDGNAPANRSLRTAVVTGVNWAPGTDLWLRWNDPQLANAADQGIAIDDLTFAALVPEPASFGFIAGAALLASLRRRPRA
jgi:hypothetical protein